MSVKERPADVRRRERTITLIQRKTKLSREQIEDVLTTLSVLPGGLPYRFLYAGFHSCQAIAEADDREILKRVYMVGPKHLQSVRAYIPHQPRPAEPAADPHPCPTCTGTGVVPPVAYA